MTRFLLMVSAALILTSCGSQKAIKPAHIPIPAEMKSLPGHFTLKPDTRITWTGGVGAAVSAETLASVLRPATGFDLSTAEGTDGDITVKLDPASEWKSEEYRLTVRRKSVTLTAGSSEGLFRGIQSFRQLLPPAIYGNEPATAIKWTIPCISVTDFPRFAWRGMHLDVSRHFFDKEFVKKYIDILAIHKINVFHWHLVDDQGWRIEIKKYPKLTEIGAWRVDREDKPWNSREPQKPGEEATYGGFYTQDEIREIVAYASEKYITVVPEIEMPATVGSALAAYPE